MYVDILFSQTKVIPIMFEHATTHYQTLQTWIGHAATHYHTRYHACFRTFSPILTWSGYNTTCYYNFNMLHARYDTFFLSLAWFGAIFNALPRTTVKFIKNIKYKKKR